MNIVLLGDSIFDNKAYVGKHGLDVITHLNNKLDPNYDTASLCAVDGAVVSDVRKQLKRIPDSATHLFLSIGGNDALGEVDILSYPVKNSAFVFNELATVSRAFEKRYARMLRDVLSLGLPLTVCTIYYPRYKDKFTQTVAKAALATFNDVIIRQAFLNRLGLIDLRLLCTENTDYANPIEPSHTGGIKIADKIIEVAHRGSTAARSQIYF